MSTPEPAVAAGIASGLDPTALRQLVGDDPGVLADLLRQYAGELQTSMEQLEHAAVDADVARLCAVAHRLKSSTRAVGAGALGQACDALEWRAREHAGKTVRAVDVQAWLPPLRASAAEVRHALAAMGIAAA